MTFTGTNSSSDVGFRYGNPAFDCNGALLRAHCRQLATVVTVTGVIDSVNVERISEYVRRFILAEKPFILDLSRVNSLCDQGISLLYTVDEDCFAAGVEWSLIAGQPVIDVLRAGCAHDDFAIAGSVPEALHHFSDAITARRKLLPLLTKTA
jgi:anti-anti-sigma regulatory factor